MSICNKCSLRTCKFSGRLYIGPGKVLGYYGVLYTSLEDRCPKMKKPTQKKEENKTIDNLKSNCVCKMCNDGLK